MSNCKNCNVELQQLSEVREVSNWGGAGCNECGQPLCNSCAEEERFQCPTCEAMICGDCTCMDCNDETPQVDPSEEPPYIQKESVVTARWVECQDAVIVGNGKEFKKIDLYRGDYRVVLTALEMALSMQGLKVTMDTSCEGMVILEAFGPTELGKFNPNYNQSALCECGHHYHRHFDSYEDWAPVGCKYCPCFEFVEAKPEDEPMPEDELMPVECPLCHKTVDFSETKVYDTKITKGSAELLVCCAECAKKGV